MIPLLAVTFDELPPSTNKLYGNRSTGGKYKFPEVVRWQQYALYTLKSKDTWKDLSAISVARQAHSSLHVSVKARLPQRLYRKRDIDNMVKILLDTGINLFMQYDDKYVDDLYLSKRCTEDAGDIHFSVAVCDEDIE